MKPLLRAINSFLLTGLVALTPLLPARAARALSAQEPSSAIANQVPLESPLDVTPGELDFRFEAGGEVFEFRAEAVPFSPYPGSLWIANSPLGAGALLKLPNAPTGSYLLGFQASGVIAIAWNENLFGSAGAAGGIAAVVTQAPIAQAQDPIGPPPPPTVGIRPGKSDGKEGVIISVTGSDACLYGFVQFVTLKVTWKGVKRSDGSGTSGVGAGPQSSDANGGKPMASDGGTTYVDAPAGSSEYPHQGHSAGPGAGQVTQRMGDSPGLNDPKPLVDDIEGANPDVEVTELTLEQRFTTYVWMDCGAGRQIIAKVEWSRTQTVPVNQDNTGPAGGPGGFGGPAAGPPAPGSPFTNGQPSVTPVGEMDPEHKAAEQNHNSGAYSGAPGNGW
jgi:hypothetical protein